MTALEETIDIKQEPHSPVNTKHLLEETIHTARASSIDDDISADKSVGSVNPIKIENDVQSSMSLFFTSRQDDLSSQSTSAVTNLQVGQGHLIKTEECTNNSLLSNQTISGSNCSSESVVQGCQVKTEVCEDNLLIPSSSQAVGPNLTAATNCSLVLGNQLKTEECVVKSLSSPFTSNPNASQYVIGEPIPVVLGNEIKTEPYEDNSPSPSLSSTPIVSQYTTTSTTCYLEPEIKAEEFADSPLLPLCSTSEAAAINEPMVVIETDQIKSEESSNNQLLSSSPVSQHTTAGSSYSQIPVMNVDKIKTADVSSSLPQSVNLSNSLSTTAKNENVLLQSNRSDIGIQNNSLVKQRMVKDIVQTVYRIIRPQIHNPVKIILNRGSAAGSNQSNTHTLYRVEKTKVSTVGSFQIPAATGHAAVLPVVHTAVAPAVGPVQMSTQIGQLGVLPVEGTTLASSAGSVQMATQTQSGHRNILRILESTEGAIKTPTQTQIFQTRIDQKGVLHVVRTQTSPTRPSQVPSQTQTCPRGLLPVHVVKPINGIYPVALHRAGLSIQSETITTFTSSSMQNQDVCSTSTSVRLPGIVSRQVNEQKQNLFNRETISEDSLMCIQNNTTKSENLVRNEREMLNKREERDEGHESEYVRVYDKNHTESRNVRFGIGDYSGHTGEGLPSSQTRADDRTDSVKSDEDSLKSEPVIVWDKIHSKSRQVDVMGTPVSTAVFEIKYDDSVIDNCEAVRPVQHLSSGCRSTSLVTQPQKPKTTSFATKYNVPAAGLKHGSQKTGSCSKTIKYKGEDFKLNLSLDEPCVNDTIVDLPKWNSSFSSLYSFRRTIEKFCAKTWTPNQHLFYCYLCLHETYCLKNLLKHHNEVHLDPSETENTSYVFKCTHCFTIMSDYRSVMSHEFCHHLSDFPCYFCGISTGSLRDMLNHIYAKHGQRITCSLCSMKFTNENELLEHCVQKNHRQPVVPRSACCPYCSMACSKDELNEHITRLHVNKAIPNKVECICYSCRHVFMDEQALNVHKKLEMKNVPIHLPDQSLLSTISSECVKLMPDGVYGSSLYSSKWTWWRRYLREETGTVRSVRVNDTTVSYPYGDLLHIFDVERTLKFQLNKLAWVIDILVKITIETFGQLHGSLKLCLTSRVQEMLSAVYFCERFLVFLKSMDMHYKLYLRGVKMSPCASEILIDEKLYRYPYREVLKYCAVEKVNTEVMPGILVGLVRVVLKEFPQLDPKVCFASCYFWGMVVTVSRTPLFACILSSASLKPLPWNTNVKRAIQCFLQKCAQCNPDFGLHDASANLKSTLSSCYSSTEVATHTVSVNTSACSTDMVNMSSVGPQATTCVPTSTKSEDVVPSPIVAQQDLYWESLHNSERTSQTLEYPELKKMFLQTLNTPLLKQQTFDLKFWYRKYGMNGIDYSIRKCTRKEHRTEDLHSGGSSQMKPGAGDKIMHAVDCTNITTSIRQMCGNVFAEYQLSGLKMNQNRLKHGVLTDETNYVNGSNVRSLNMEKKNTDVVATESQVPSISKLNSTSQNSSWNPGMVEKPRSSLCINNDIEKLPKWKKSVILFDNFNEKIKDLYPGTILTHNSCYLCSYVSNCLIDLHTHVEETHFLPKDDICDRQCNMCTHCFEKQTDFAALRAHEIEQHLSEFPCYLCGFSNDTLSNMLNHIIKDHCRVFVCDVCNLECQNATEFKEHCSKEGQHHSSYSKRFYCRYCVISYTKSVTLRKHVLKNHVHSPIPNTNERVCFSCRHTFVDDRALKTHQVGACTKYNDSLHTINSSTLTSLQMQCEELKPKFDLGKFPSSIDCDYSFNHGWWQGYLRNVSRVSRTVTVYGEAIHYSYRDIVYCCKVNSSLVTSLYKLPVVIDKLVVIVLERYRHVFKNRQLLLDADFCQMLAAVCVSGVYSSFLKSMGMEEKFLYLNWGCVSFVNEATKIVLGEKMYIYPYEILLAYCSDGSANGEIMPSIIYGLLQLIFAEFPRLDPSKCFGSDDFYEVVVTVSRTPMFEKLLTSVKLPLLSWNERVSTHINSFLLKCALKDSHSVVLNKILYSSVASSAIASASSSHSSDKNEDESTLLRQMLDSSLWKSKSVQGKKRKNTTIDQKDDDNTASSRKKVKSQNVHAFCANNNKRFRCSTVILERNVVAEKLAAEIIQNNKKLSK